ncbi:hypothetical protein FRC04_004684 [Tulasnella sp. 424]|nr:hypothetical protein FRC04_004684 [Tulasnella sp. 424]KAG8965023.1 hypothetical protein FRC05_003498 [Tulasnella sp. 425]
MSTYSNAPSTPSQGQLYLPLTPGLERLQALFQIMRNRFVSPPAPTPAPGSSINTIKTVCEEKPPNPGFKHCSIECAIAEKAVKVAQPVNLIRMWLCETCGEKLSASGYKYCSPECSRKALSIEDAFSQLSVSTSSIGPRKCIIEGCDKAEWKPGSKYCGNACRAFGVILQLDPACLLCETFPKMNKSYFCSASCSNKSLDNAPVLLSVPAGHQALTTVTDQWTKEWKHTANPPQIRFMWLIVQNRSLHNAFEAKLQAIDASYNFKAEGMFPANERRRWHGTKRECTVGDPGTTPTGFCKSPTCSMCIVMQRSFDKEKCAAGSMFGKGVYTSGTSSKSHGYIKQVAPSRYRAMLMCRVLAGRAKKLTSADHNLVTAPTGYDSVRGVPGGGLNYDELIVYDNNQIRPLYLVIYDST